MAFLSLNVLWNTLYACEEECGMGRWWPALIGWRVVSCLRRATTTVVAWATLSVHFPRGSRREVVVLSSNSSSTTHQTEHYCTLILFVNDTYCAFVNTFGIQSSFICVLRSVKLADFVASYLKKTAIISLWIHIGLVSKWIYSTISYYKVCDFGSSIKAM